MNRISFAIALLSAAIASRVIAQSTIGDSENKTALVLGSSGGVLSVNFTDNSAKGGYAWRGSASPYWFGVEFSGKAANGYASLFDGSGISPEAGASVWAGYQPKHYKKNCDLSKAPTSWVRDWWLGAKLSYTRGEYVLIDKTKPLDEQAGKKSLDAPELALFINALTRGNILAGVQGGIRRTSNYGDLDEVDVIDRTAIGSAGTTERILEKKTSGRSGDYRELMERFVNADLFWVPGCFNNRVGVDGFIRYTYPDQGTSSFEPGVGFFILEKGAPTKIIAGITVQRDATEEKMKLGLSLGYNF